jgi:hypothetical protein
MHKLSTLMRSKAYALPVLATFLGTSLTEAAITYDGFDYVVSGNLAGNTNWTPLNTGTAPVIASGNLSVPGLASPTGNKVSFLSGNIQEAIGALNTYNTDTVYFSLALSLTSVPTTATYSLGLSTSNTNYGATVWLQAAGSDYNIGLANRSTSTPTYDTTAFALNTTVFLVGAYTFVSGTGNDVSTLWINPSAATFGAETAPAFTLQATGGTDMTAITQFLLRGAAGSPAGEIDELRIGTSWASVTPVPEPSAFAALLGGASLLGLVRRRRA